MTFEEHAYELPEIWEEAWFSQEDRDRFREVAALVPSDAKSLVDVGCGNGLFVNGLHNSDATRFDRIAGVDRSAAALAHVRVTRCRARVDALPFRDRSFDMASSMEVLEHLPVAVYPLALGELARVARNVRAGFSAVPAGSRGQHEHVSELQDAVQRRLSRPQL